MFTSSLQLQRDKFIEMLDHAVNALTRLETIEDDIYQLGVRHGIDEAHFDFAATARLTTLHEVLGDEKTLKKPGTRPIEYWQAL